METVKGWVIYSGESQSKELIYSIEQEIKEKSKIERETKFILNMYQKGYTLEEIADVAEKTVEEVKTILGK